MCSSDRCGSSSNRCSSSNNGCKSSSSDSSTNSSSSSSSSSKRRHTKSLTRSAATPTRGMSYDVPTVPLASIIFDIPHKQKRQETARWQQFAALERSTLATPVCCLFTPRAQHGPSGQHLYTHTHTLFSPVCLRLGVLRTQKLRSSSAENPELRERRG